jgi:predicted alpha/beta-fold hydrolase
MTVFARLSRGPTGLAPRRERWELDDGDFLDVDRHGDPDAPTVVALHGLEGSSRTPYVRRLVAACLAHGLSALAVNFRGCSGEPNRLPRLYHSGETSDLARVVERLSRERPGRALGIAGFSLGGNVVAKWFGESGARLPPEVRAGAVISVPFDLGRCAAAIDAGGGMTFVYRERFLRTLRAKAIAKTQLFGSLPFTSREVAACRTFAEFDDRVTARVHGFADAEDYWRRCSSARYLDGISRPLLAISAEDDPIVPSDTLPRDTARTSSCLQLETHRAGGHVGFVSGPPWRFEFFAEARAAPAS